MPASKPATRHSSADAFGETDLAKVDAHIVQPHEYKELPELTDEWFEQADKYVGDTLIRRGNAPRTVVTVALDADLLDALTEAGVDWQTGISAALREWLAKRPAQPVANPPTPSPAPRKPARSASSSARR